MAKFRKSIVESMKMAKIEQYGFFSAYYRLEKSLNSMEKEGDVAEALALQYLIDNQIIGEHYELNKVIELRNIKMEADIIDHENKIVYEVKSRKLYDVGRSEIRKKWNLFQHQKGNSFYAVYKFQGIVVTKEANSVLKVHKPNLFLNAKYNHALANEKMQSYFKLLNEYKTIAKPIKHKKHFK